MVKKSAGSVKRSRGGRAVALPPRSKSGVDLWSLKSDWVQTSLTSGANAGELEDLFGAEVHQELSMLARQAAATRRRGGVKVLILPGIMGSTLGYPQEGWFDDTVWIDPVDIAAGQLRLLSLDTGDKAIKPLGVVLVAYLLLKLRLEIAGYDAAFYPFDWRQSIEVLGEQLAKHLKTLTGPVQIVAHSMGGLVTRAACSHKPVNLTRVVTLGTPNFGSFSPLQAFRGGHSLVNAVQVLDVHHDGNELAAIFASFPGLAQMIPSPAIVGTDYFELAHWPGQGFHPRQSDLSKARQIQQDLWTPTAGDSPEWVQVIGVGQETVVSARLDAVSHEFEYGYNLEGDGTVPLKCATLPAVHGSYYIEAEHGTMCNSASLADALKEILREGKTDKLPDRAPLARSRSTLRYLSETQLRLTRPDGSRPRGLSTRERRDLLKGFAAGAEAADFAQSAAVELSPTFSERLVIGRRSLRRLDINLVLGDMVEVESRAYVLGLFRNVAPGGVVPVLDALMQGALSTILQRRMFSANAGAISFVPRGRHPIRADFVSFVGLGAFDQFRDDVFEVIGENLVRTFAATGLDEFAMLPFGGGSDSFKPASLRCLFVGFLRALTDADPEQRFRGVTICETDPLRFGELRDELYRLCGTPLFDQVEVTLRERRITPTRMLAPLAAVERVGHGRDYVYLNARQDIDADGQAMLNLSLLTAGGKAAIFQGQRIINETWLAATLRRFSSQPPTAGPWLAADMPALGGQFVAELLPASIAEALEQFPDHHLVLVHDAGASRIPWDAIRVGDHMPALTAGISHRYESRNLTVAKWLERRQDDGRLDVLLIIDPTNDLEGAQAEGDHVENLLNGMGSVVRVQTLRGEQATRDAVLAALRSGDYDVIHYAGHAYFDAANPSSSGLTCAKGVVLSGQDLVSLGSLPALLFANACETARVRGIDSATPVLADSMALQLRSSVGFAEALLSGGIANYIGTYWPVGDEAAKSFAKVFYSAIVAGESLGVAVLNGRRSVDALPDRDWADYIHYGDPEFVIKRIAR